ncbi:MAG: nuclear transport factor 2 family protein [Actinomycetota bacterium]|nr:nuclear transport factor 2 family protein [Actinomycetota bacterium]
MIASEVRIVKTWHEALNEGDVGRLVALSHPNIELGGPRGTGRGSQLLREWVTRANIRLEPRRILRQADTVIVEQEAEWRSPETGQVTGSQTVASVFVIHDGRVASLSRYDDLAEALRTANLNESHEALAGQPLTSGTARGRET